MAQQTHKKIGSRRLGLTCCLLAAAVFLTAGVPSPRASRAAGSQVCPSVKISGCPEVPIGQTALIDITAGIQNAPQGSNLTYSWTLSDSREKDRSKYIGVREAEGPCESGHSLNTDKVCIDPENLRGQHTARVTVGGWPAGCSGNSDECKFTISDAAQFGTYTDATPLATKTTLITSWAKTVSDMPQARGVAFVFTDSEDRVEEAMVERDFLLKVAREAAPD